MPFLKIFGDREMTTDKIRQKIQQVKQQRLTELHLSHNSLTEIPTEVFELEWLETLSLNGNQLTSVPDAIARLTNLSTLDLSYNPLEDPPLEIAEQGIDAIREYFRQKQAGEEKRI
jgi:leucine-rich repeat protein SHOC2